jgi:DNA-binding Xre family transcriptional regulator
MGFQASTLKTLTDRLKRDADKHGKGALANIIGIHLTTLNSLLNDTWERIERDTIERLCDHLECKLGEFLELERSTFWNALTETGEVNIFRANEIVNNRKIPKDENAKVLVEEFCRDKLGCQVYLVDYENEKKTIDFVKNNNCIVIGAHSSNLAAEVIVARMYGAKPRDSSEENQKKIPFRFIGREQRVSSAFFDGRDSASRRGIELVAGGSRFSLKADRWPKDDFLKLAGVSGEDAAVVLVANRPFGTRKNVKTIILAGFTQTGTLAAAQMLIRDFRNLEPAGPELVLGLLYAPFKKKVQGERVEIIEEQLTWKYLTGGRRTVQKETTKATAER